MWTCDQGLGVPGDHCERFPILLKNDARHDAKGAKVNQILLRQDSVQVLGLARSPYTSPRFANVAMCSPARNARAWIVIVG
jgi:hypothetical protein